MSSVAPEGKFILPFNNTTNPFEIADALGIIVQTGKLGFEGCYMFLKNHRCIFLSEDLSDHDRTLVMAHELGHAIIHRKKNKSDYRTWKIA